jgi:hypothetical protein
MLISRSRGPTGGRRQQAIAAAAIKFRSAPPVDILGHNAERINHEARNARTRYQHFG